MPTPGYVFRDGGTTPPLEREPDSELRRRLQRGARARDAVRHGPLTQNTSTSHQLAVGDTDTRGAAQRAGTLAGTTNLGWQKNAKGVDQLVGGIDNDDLWTLIRRFNKVSQWLREIYHA